MTFNPTWASGGGGGVPYTGATENLNLGSYKLIATGVQASNSGGGHLQTNGGANCVLFGAGGSANGTLYGGWNYDNATANTLAYYGASKTLSSVTLGGGLNLSSGNLNVTGWEKIETKTASDSASLVFTGLSGTYLQYKIVLARLVPATNDVDLYMRTSTDNGANYDSGASDYQFAGDLRRVGGSATVSSAASSRMAMALAIGNTANLGGANGEIEILSFSAATYFHAHSIITHSYVTTPTFAVTRIGNWRLAAADVDAVQLYFESGNIASGTATLYGLRA